MLHIYLIFINFMFFMPVTALKHLFCSYFPHISSSTSPMLNFFIGTFVLTQKANFLPFYDQQILDKESIKVFAFFASKWSLFSFELFIEGLQQLLKESTLLVINFYFVLKVLKKVWFLRMKWFCSLFFLSNLKFLLSIWLLWVFVKSRQHFFS